MTNRLHNRFTTICREMPLGETESSDSLGSHQWPIRFGEQLDAAKSSLRQQLFAALPHLQPLLARGGLYRLG